MLSHHRSFRAVPIYDEIIENSSNISYNQYISNMLDGWRHRKPESKNIAGTYFYRVPMETGGKRVIAPEAVFFGRRDARFFGYVGDAGTGSDFK